MPNYAKVCFYGLLISFVGALPFGTLNLTAFDIAASQGLVSAIWFAMAVVLVELSVVRITLYGNERLHLGERALKYILPLGIVFLLYLSLSSFLEMDSVTVTDTKTDFFPQIGSTFVLGLLLSALNPLQFPFWMTWNQVLGRKGILQRSNSHYVFYILGIGLGTLVGLGIFILAGKFIFANYDRYHTITNLMMGLLYLGFSFYLMFIFIKKRIHHKIE
jgi:threonine/homoserine/homoserine lactone efflux protein